MQLSNNAAIRQVKVNGINYGINGECYMSNELDWSTSTYVPAHGEIIIYRELSAPFNTRFKVGDGTTNVNALPFVNDFITDNEIDAICGAIIYNTDEVML